MKAVFLVFLGGGLGSALRYGVGKWLNNSETAFPLGTFSVNILGSLIIGIILGYALKNESISQNTLLFLATGFCGGFTTFSAFAYENFDLLKNGDLVNSGIYTLSSLIFGIGAVYLGVWLIKFF
ncbi:MAG: fluoride efflux transporter CrcB [Flavobacteriaceae bacterium]|nr:fluoride efflux transporter CrcB [Flavobacteriaceae bacterium]